MLYRCLQSDGDPVHAWIPHACLVPDHVYRTSEAELTDMMNSLQEALMEKTMEKQELWMKAEGLEEQLRTAKTRGGLDGGGHGAGCTRCQKEFTASRLQHHCKSCGYVDIGLDRFGPRFPSYVPPPHTPCAMLYVVSSLDTGC